MPWLTGFASLLLVIALILLTRYGVKFVEPYLARGRRTRDLAVVESLSIDQRRKLSLIRCKDRTGLILTGGGSDVFLGWMDEPQPPAAPAFVLPEIDLDE
ncbi:flagellar biosynthetic protein FliO [Acetobacter sp. TBRC 12305]|uniref:Flagellar biosynthetic protein FliO n=1 Tax=Acetobacter garciniae TaxID=2817435 RepID=A0A939HJU7_9PROT|nr:flagellar biosynthetic protein FliO [Acetobacter garciniae]MBO1324767.1 flagellar biosynthetic protein FliO [Acetobacter garciniae]MBX0344458.1 flagellar biosynthetic protein FliO [Acetobacter garciniae]